MNCRHCGDKGIIRQRYHSGEPDEFALCLCAAGLAWRCDTNAGRRTFPLWHLWAAREHIDHERVWPIEDFCEEAEIARMFPARPIPKEQGLRENVLLSAGRTRKGKL